LERRRGEKIAAKGIYRDAVRSSKSFLVKSSGLRWISLMLLAPIPWAGRVWALPFLTVLAPSKRYHQQQGRAHKTLVDWAAQMIAQVRRWLPQRRLVLVADSSYAALTFLYRCCQFKNPVVLVTRLRLDAALFEPAPQPAAKQRGRPRKKGERLPTLQQVLDSTDTLWRSVTLPRWYSQGQRRVQVVSGTGVWYHKGMPVVPLRWVLIRDPDGKFAPQALLCSDLSCDPVQIIAWFVQRWQLEVTFAEVRRHLGVETQRQWNERAILRSTPALFGLFSLVVLLAHQQAQAGALLVRRAAWYVKAQPTFSDAIASVRRSLWNCSVFATCSAKTDRQKLQQALLERFADTLCYAA
jgi:DDE superfamily endonuclease